MTVFCYGRRKDALMTEGERQAAGKTNAVITTLVERTQVDSGRQLVSRAGEKACV